MTAASVPIPAVPTAHHAANSVARHVGSAAHKLMDGGAPSPRLERPESHLGLQEEGDGGATIGPSVEEHVRGKALLHHPAGGTRKVRTVPPFAAFDPPSPVMSPKLLPTDDVPRASLSTSPTPAQRHTHRHGHYPHLSLSSDLTRTLSSRDDGQGSDQPPPWWTFAKPGRWKQVQTLHNAWVEQMLANEELRRESEHLGRDYFASKRGSGAGVGTNTEAMPGHEEGEQGEDQTESGGLPAPITTTNSGETPNHNLHHRPPFAMSALQSGMGSYFHLGKLRRRSVSQEDFGSTPIDLSATASAGTPTQVQTQMSTPVGTPSAVGIGAQHKTRHKTRFKAISLPVSRRDSTDNTRNRFSALFPPSVSASPSVSAVEETSAPVHQPPNTGEHGASEGTPAVPSSAVNNKIGGNKHQVTSFVLGPPIGYSDASSREDSAVTTAMGDGPSSSIRAVEGEHLGIDDASVPSTPTPSRQLEIPPQTTERPVQQVTSSALQLAVPEMSDVDTKTNASPTSPHKRGNHPNFSITLPPPAFVPHSFPEVPALAVNTETEGTTTTTMDGCTGPVPPPMYPQPHRYLAQAPPTPLGWDAPWRERDQVGRRLDRGGGGGGGGGGRAGQEGKRGGRLNGNRDSGYASAASDPWLQPFEETAYDGGDLMERAHGEEEHSVRSVVGGGGRPSEEESGGRSERAGRRGSESSGGPLTGGNGMSEKHGGLPRTLRGKKSRGGSRLGKNRDERAIMSKWAMLRHSAVKNPPGTRRAKLRKYFIFDARSTLYLRLASLVGIATSLGLGAKLYSLEIQNDLDGILGSAPILSISYGSVSAIHCLIVMYREAFGKPIGLWGLRSKMTWVCLDLFFIALWSSCLSLTISDYMSSPLQCSTANPWWTTGTYTITLPDLITNGQQKDKMCDRQAALIGFVLFTLVMYVINMVISLFRIFERLSTVAKSYEKSRVGQLV
ncbi:hypothetical protein QFC19_006689 [Naganishia cerealis]|uniref:Uncharacterized protein n=1 Tax=Naganishia cerealis TaxID=610337 RepID=A0ACC2VFI0_9TREE|nr:hypothetical protein QFC19_006689 [Naganishia cerealis]